MADDSGWTIDPAGGQGWAIDPDPAIKQAWTLDPLTAQPKGALASAIEGKTQDETAAEAARETSLREIATEQQGRTGTAKLDDGLTPLESVGRYYADTARGVGAGLVRGAGSIPSGLESGWEAAERTSARMTAKMLGQDFVDHWMQPAYDAWDSTIGKGATAAGEAVQGFADKFDVPLERRDSASNVVANAVGQMAGQIVAFAAGGAEAGTVAYLAQSFDQVAEAIKQKGIDGPEAGKTPLPKGTAGGDAAILIAAPIMSKLEKLGIFAILDRVPKAIKNRVLRGFVDVGLAGGIEAAEELGEQLTQNIALKAGVDPNQSLTEGFGPSASGGGGAGAIMRAILGRWGRAAPRTRTDDQLGQAAEPRVPQPGRSYSPADAIAELGMTPDEAATFASTGHDPRGTGVGEAGPLGIREGAALSPDITAADEASPLPTDRIVHGRMAMATAAATPVANEALRSAGMPDVGTRVEVTHNGKTERGAIADSWTVSVGGENSVGVKIRLDDGTMVEEPVDTLHDLGVVIRPEKLGLPEGDLADPEVRKFVEQGLADVGPAPEATEASGGEWAVDAPQTPVAAPAGRGGGNLPGDVVQGLVARGIPEHVARGAAAGAMAESRGDHNALNPTSGAMGIGQWLGSRKDELIRRYGQKPTREQQIEYLAWELKGGDFGGKAVLAATDEAGALDAYIRKFMRPAAGAETDGDLKRGRAALGGVQTDMFGGTERSGAEIDADRAVEEAAAPDSPVEPVDLVDNAHSVLESAAKEDEALLAHASAQLGSSLGTRLTPEEGPVFARAVLRRLGDQAPGQGLGGSKLDDQHVRFADGLDIPRAEMPQIKAEHRGAMVNFLNARGISHEEVTLPAHALRASQAEFNVEKVAKAKEFTGGDRAILIDQDNHVVDGHHQWVAAHDRGQDVRAIKLNATVQEVSKALEDMPSAETPGADQQLSSGQLAANNPVVVDAPRDTSGVVDRESPSGDTQADAPSLVREGFGTPQQAGLWIKNQKLPTPRYQVEGDQSGAYRVIDTAPEAAPTRDEAEPALSKQEQMRSKQIPKRDPDTEAKIPQPNVVKRPSKAEAKKRPMTVIAFVRQIGGIKNNEGHNLTKGRGLHRHPGLINNKSGRSIDGVGEALWEAGYIGTPDERPTVAEVLDLLDEADGRPIYRMSEQADVEMDAAEEAGREQEEAARDDIKAVASEAQLNLTDDEIESALLYVIRGDTTEDAIERAVQQSAALDLLDVAAVTQSEYEHVDVADEIFASFAFEADRGAQTGSDGPLNLEGAPSESETPAGKRPEAAAPEEQPQAAPERDTSGSEQLDAFGLQPGDERRALERQAEGRLRSSAKQKAPGDEGGLFDVQDKTGDILADDGVADTSGASPPRAGLVALYDDEDTAKQIGWFNPATGAVEQLGAAQPSKEREAVRARGEPARQPASVEISLADVDRIRGRLLQRMAELGIEDRYSLEIANGLRLTKDSTLAEIDLYRRVIRIALGRGDAEHSLDHEAIHALGPNGLRAITPAEWSVIVEAAWADDRLREWAQTAPAYQGLSLEDQKEEAAAEYFADEIDRIRGRADSGVPLGRVKGILYRAAYRVGRLVNALRHAVSILRTGQAAELSLVDVIVRLDKGVVGRRKGRLDGKTISVNFGGKVLAQAEPVVPTREARSLKEARAAAKAFVGKRLRNASIDVDAVVSGATLGKMTSEKAVRASSSGPDHALAVANLDQLYPASVEISRAPDRAGDTNFKSIIRTAAPMVAPDGRQLQVRMLVKEMSDSNIANPLYTVTVEEVGPASVPDFTARVPGQSRDTPPTGPDADIGDVETDANTRSQAASRPLPVEGRSEERSPSGITRLAADIKTATPAFKRWFGRSQVVNDGGAPLVMYHGTARDQGGDAFTMFDTYASNYGLMGMGGYFTADPAIASAYTKKGRGETPTVYPVYLSIQKPIDMDAAADPAAWQKHFEGIEDFHEGGETNESWYRAAEELLMTEELPMYEGAEVMQDGLRAMGYDGITHLGGGRVHADGARHRVFVAFDPEQIKSASGNAGTFDGTNPDIRAQAAPPSKAAPGPMGRTLEDGDAPPPRLWRPVRAMIDAAGSGGTSERIGDAIDRWRTVLQDRMLPVLRTQARVERMIGRQLTDEENPYLGEELVSGRVGARLEELADQHIEPLFQAMREAKTSPDELQSFMYARHAPERNARIAAINPEFAQGEGSGMTDAEAAAIMQAVRESGKRHVLEALAAKVDAVNEFALRTRVEAGLLSEAEANAWRATYQHYVPLRGQQGDGEGSAEPARARRQPGISVKGKESQRAFGRKTRADDILPYIILQAEEAIVRAEQNRVAQSFLDLVRAAPDADFWKIDKVRRVPVFNKSSGTVSYRAESRVAADDAPYTVSAKVDGEEHRVTMNRDNAAAVRVADAMRNLSAQQFGAVVRTFGAVNRFLSAINTSYSPEFVISNALRDLQSATINLTGEKVKGIVRNVLKDYPRALRAATKGAFGKTDGDWGRWYSEFKLEGGRTYFNHVDDIERLKGRVQQAAKAAHNRLGAKSMLFAVRDVIENVNSGVENALRLATYKNAREAGLSKGQAASLAKNVTVNFNRKGSAGPLINSLYLFFNASMQGSFRIFGAMRSRKVQALLLAGVSAGFWLQILNALWSDDDDDGEKFYAKVPEFEKRRNLILMLPGQKGRYVKVPMPWGYNVFPNLGRMLAELYQGERPVTSISNWATSVLDAFNPVGGASSILNLLAPTVADPIVDLVRNRDYADRPIMPDEKQFGPQTPDAQRYWNSVPPYWKAVSDFLTTATGGDDVRAGAIDVSPETLDYMQQTVLGAAGNFVRNNMALASKLISDDPDDVIDKNDLPFVHRVVGEKPTWYDKAAFYARVGQVEQTIDYAKKYDKSGNEAGLDKLFDDSGDVLRLDRAAKHARKRMRAIGKERRRVENALANGDLDPERGRAMTLRLDEDEEEAITSFNARYVASVDQALRP